MKKIHDILRLMDNHVEKALYSAGKYIPEPARDIIIKNKNVTLFGSAAVSVVGVLYAPLMLPLAIAAVGLEPACEITNGKEFQKELSKDSIDEIVESKDTKPTEKPAVIKTEVVEEVNIFRYVISEGPIGKYHLRCDLSTPDLDVVHLATQAGWENVCIGTLKSPDQNKLYAIEVAVNEANEAGVFDNARLNYLLQNPPQRPKTPSQGTSTSDIPVGNTGKQPHVDHEADTQDIEVIAKDDRIKTIYLAAANDKGISEVDFVLNYIKDTGIYTPNILYRGFNGEKLQTMMEEGTDLPDRDTIFCSTEPELFREQDGTYNAMFFALNNENSALAVYDRSKLSGDYCDLQEYKFKDPSNKLEALIAVLILK